MARMPALKRTLCKFFERGECDRGELCTWAHGVEELGAPNVQAVPDEAFFDAPEAEAPMEEPVQVLRTICKFWQEGRCKNGDLCTWAHGEHELGAPFPRQLADEAALDEAELGAEGDFADELLEDTQDLMENPEELIEELQRVEEPAGAVKRTICKFWQEGKCRNGELCTWAHGEDEIGTPLIENAPGPGQRGGTILPVARPGPAWADRQPPPEQEAPGGIMRTICKFWLEGKCTKGDACTWAHGEEEIGQPAPLPEVGPVPREMLIMPAPQRKGWKGDSRGFGGSFGSGALPYGPRVAPFKGCPGKGVPALPALGGKGAWGAPGWAAQAQPAAAGPPVKRTICKFWQQGICDKGDQCTWLHGDEDYAPVRRAPPLIVPVRRSVVGTGGPVPPPQQFGPGEVAVRRTICKFWLEGACRQPPGQCTWAHGEEEIGTAVEGAPSGTFSSAIPTSVVTPPWKRPRF